MGNKVYWVIIFITIAVNVVMLQWTIESYFGKEFEHVWTYSTVAMISSIICLITFFRWKKQEYR